MCETGISISNSERIALHIQILCKTKRRVAGMSPSLLPPRLEFTPYTQGQCMPYELPLNISQLKHKRTECIKLVKNV